MLEVAKIIIDPRPKPSAISNHGQTNTANQDKPISSWSDLHPHSGTPNMYDIKQVTRYVLMRTDPEGRASTDIAEFKRRDEAEAVLKALNGRFEAERAAAKQYVAQQIRDGNPLYPTAIATAQDTAAVEYAQRRASVSAAKPGAAPGRVHTGWPAPWFKLTADEDAAAAHNVISEYDRS